jgi:hypothetical protein
MSPAENVPQKHAQTHYRNQGQRGNKAASSRGASVCQWRAMASRCANHAHPSLAYAAAPARDHRCAPEGVSDPLIFYPRSYRYYACPLVPGAGRGGYASFPARSSAYSGGESLCRPQRLATCRRVQQRPPCLELVNAVNKCGSSAAPPGRGKSRARTVPARQQERVLDASAQAKRRLGWPASATVMRCDTAGRAGCWLPRLLPGHGRPNPGVASSSMEGKRRRRRAKSEE